MNSFVGFCWAVGGEDVCGEEDGDNVFPESKNVLISSVLFFGGVERGNEKEKEDISHKRRAGVDRTTLEFRPGIQTKETTREEKEGIERKGKKKNKKKLKKKKKLKYIPHRRSSMANSPHPSESGVTSHFSTHLFF